jgi:4-hydroxy-tetrahydrodipicolinate synthase
VAAATDLPVVMYDVPSRTGRAISVATIVRLANEVPNIVGLKDARGNPTQANEIIAGAPDDFDLYSGDTGLTLSLLAVGAVGVVGVCSHWTAGLHADMIAAFEKGDVLTARQINARLAPSFAVESSDTWVHTAAAKAAMAALGQPAGPCRLPLPPLGDDVRAAVRTVLDDLGLAARG